MRVIGDDGIRLSYCCIASPLESLGDRPASAFVTNGARAKNKIVAGEPYAFIIVLVWACCCRERNWENRWSETVCENGEEPRDPIIRPRG